MFANSHYRTSMCRRRNNKRIDSSALKRTPLILDSYREVEIKRSASGQQETFKDAAQFRQRVVYASSGFAATKATNSSSRYSLRTSHALLAAGAPRILK